MLYFSMQFLDLYKKIDLKRYILIRSSWFYQSLITLMKFFHWYQIPIWFKTASKSRKLIWHDLSLHFSCIFIFMYICLNKYFNANANVWCMLYVYFKLISTVRIKLNYELLFHPIQLRDTVVESCKTSSRIACYSSELVNVVYSWYEISSESCSVPHCMAVIIQNKWHIAILHVIRYVMIPA